MLSSTKGLGARNDWVDDDAGGGGRMYLKYLSKSKCVYILHDLVNIMYINVSSVSSSIFSEIHHQSELTRHSKQTAQTKNNFNITEHLYPTTLQRT